LVGEAGPDESSAYATVGTANPRSADEIATLLAIVPRG
jgi:hypothetical protein